MGKGDGYLTKTKFYVGKHISSTPVEKGTIVLTDQIIVKVKDDPQVPDGALCYIRMGYMRGDIHPDIAFHLQKQWFTWNGAENEYLLINNVLLKQ